LSCTQKQNLLLLLFYWYVLQLRTTAVLELVTVSPLLQVCELGATRQWWHRKTLESGVSKQIFKILVFQKH